MAGDQQMRHPREQQHPNGTMAGHNQVKYMVYCLPGLVSPGACIQLKIGAHSGVGMSLMWLAPSHWVAT
jgi:hypothetical protein